MKQHQVRYEIDMVLDWRPDQDRTLRQQLVDYASEEVAVRLGFSYLDDDTGTVEVDGPLFVVTIDYD